MCIPRDPDVFGQPVSPKSASVARTTRGDCPDLSPADARHRIEIDAQLVGMIEIVGAHRVRMQFEAGEIRHPRERRRVARHDFLGGAARRKLQRDDVDPRRPRRRRALLVEELAARCRSDSARARWAAARAPQRTVGDREVVADEIELGVRRPRETAPCADSRSGPHAPRLRRSRIPCDWPLPGYSGHSHVGGNGSPNEGTEVTQVNGDRKIFCFGSVNLRCLRCSVFESVPSGNLR